MAALELVASHLDMDPDLRLVSFEQPDDERCFSLLGGEDPVDIEDVQVWYGIDDGNRTDHALDRATLVGNELTVTLTEKGAAVTGSREVHITIDVPDLDDELAALRRVLAMLFESDMTRLSLGPAPPPKKVAASAMGKSAEPAKAPARVNPAAVALLKLLTERSLVEIEEGVELNEVAARIAPLLSLLPEKRARKAVVQFFFDEPAIAEVYADEDVLYKIAREYLG